MSEDNKNNINILLTALEKEQLQNKSDTNDSIVENDTSTSALPLIVAGSLKKEPGENPIEEEKIENEDNKKGRSLRTKARKRHYDMESDDDAFKDVPSPKSHRKSNIHYYSDEEYLPEDGSKKKAISDNEVASLDENGDEVLKKKRKFSKRGRKRKSDINQIDEHSSNNNVFVSTEQVSIGESDSDIEKNLSRNIISLGKDKDGNIIQKVVNPGLKIKKFNQNENNVSLVIPTLNLPELHQKVEKTCQTEVKAMSSKNIQTTSPYAISLKQTVNFNEEQSNYACKFMTSILKTTSELGNLMTSKADEFISKKVNVAQMQTTANLDYCIKKAFLLFKLAKDNLTTMEETLEQQFEEFINTHKLSETVDIERKLTPKEENNGTNSDSDVEIVDETPAPKKTTTAAAKKVFLNKELSIKIAKKPQEKPKADSKSVNIPGRHAVWINNSIMVKKVKSNANQSFLAQDSRTKKPPDSYLLKLCNNFFREYELQNMKRKYFSLLTSPDWYHTETNNIVCNYFSAVDDINIPTSSNVSESSINQDFIDDYINNGEVELETTTEYNMSPKEVPLNNPECLKSLCLQILNKLYGLNKQIDASNCPESLLEIAIQRVQGIEIEEDLLRTIDDFLEESTNLQLDDICNIPAASSLSSKTVLSLKKICYKEIVSLLNNYKTESEDTIVKKPITLLQLCMTTVLKYLNLNLMNINNYPAHNISDNRVIMGDIHNILKGVINTITSSSDSKTECIPHDNLSKYYQQYPEPNKSYLVDHNHMDYVKVPSLLSIALNQVTMCLTTTSTHYYEVLGECSFLERGDADDIYVNSPNTLRSLTLNAVLNLLKDYYGPRDYGKLNKLETLKTIALSTINRCMFESFTFEEFSAMPVITGVTTLNAVPFDDMINSDNEFYDDFDNNIMEQADEQCNLPTIAVNIKVEPEDYPVIMNVKTEKPDYSDYMLEIPDDTLSDMTLPTKQELSDMPIMAEAFHDFESAVNSYSKSHRRQYEPDSDDDIATHLTDDLLVPVGTSINNARKQLLDSSDSEQNASSPNKASKPKRKTKRRTIKQNDKSKERSKVVNKGFDDASEITTLTRRMREKLKSQRGINKPDSDDECLYSLPLEVSVGSNDGMKSVCVEFTNPAQTSPQEKEFSGFSNQEQKAVSRNNRYLKYIIKKLINVTKAEQQQIEDEIMLQKLSKRISNEEIEDLVNKKVRELKKSSEVTSEMLVQSEEVTKQKQECRIIDSWELYHAIPNDVKLLVPPNVELEKLPETFVQTYFEYIKSFESIQSNEQREIDRLTDLKSLHRKRHDESNLRKPIRNDTSSKKKLETNEVDPDVTILTSGKDDQLDVEHDSDGTDDREYDDNEDYQQPSPMQSMLEPDISLTEKTVENDIARNTLIADSDESEEEQVQTNIDKHVPRKTRSKAKLKSNHVEVNIKIEVDEFGNEVNSKVIRSDSLEPKDKPAKIRRPGPKSKTHYIDPSELVLTAEKTMKENLDRLHAPVNLPTDNEPPIVKKTQPQKKAEKKSTPVKTHVETADKQNSDTSDEEEKEWLTTKEKLLKSMKRKEMRKNLMDDVKGSELVKSFIVKRSNMPLVPNRRLSRRQKRALIERMKLGGIPSEEASQQLAKLSKAVPSTSYFKGRKNIKKVIDRKLLARSTVIANKEEYERKQRLLATRSQLRKLFNLDDSINVFIINGELCLEFDMEACKPVVFVHKDITNVMKPHQYEGVKFMWDACFESLSRSLEPGGGCILAHCMGLGKTLQVIALLHTILTHPELNTRTVLVCCPLSTVLNWVDEIQHWLSPIKHKIKVFELSKLKKLYQKAYQLDDWYKEGGIFILGYEMFRSLASIDPLLDDVRETLANKIKNALLEPGPDLVVCDEGHLLKNEQSALALAMSQIRTKRRIVLTGTPMQNNLREYYCMVNFVKPNLLGTYREYLNRFEDPIMNGQHRDSSEEDIRLMKARSHILHKVLEGCLQRLEASVLYPYLPTKHEFVLFVSLTKCQTDVYRHYINNYSRKQGTFKDFHILQKIWTHPQVLHNFYTSNGVMKKEVSEFEDTMKGVDENVTIDEKEGQWWTQFVDNDVMDQLNSSNKFKVVFEILNRCVQIKDKVLIFSSSLFTLNSLEHFLQKCNSWNLGKEYYRIDGSVPLEIRQKWCREFNSEKNKVTKLFLISTRAGCLGLNLTGANRVIILDTSWNPAHDIQSIFRVYRFGQTKDCFIYRVVAKGTMEQKIYERSVTKQAVSCRVVDEQQIDRHYNMDELNALYTFDENAASECTDQIEEDEQSEDLGDSVVSSVCKKVGKYVIRSVQRHDSLLRHMCDQQLDENERAAAWRQFHMEEQKRNKILNRRAKPDLNMDTNETVKPFGDNGSESIVKLEESIFPDEGQEINGDYKKRKKSKTDKITPDKNKKKKPEFKRSIGKKTTLPQIEPATNNLCFDDEDDLFLKDIATASKSQNTSPNSNKNIIKLGQQTQRYPSIEALNKSLYNGLMSNSSLQVRQINKSTIQKHTDHHNNPQIMIKSSNNPAETLPPDVLKKILEVSKMRNMQKILVIKKNKRSPVITQELKMAQPVATIDLSDDESEPLVNLKSTPGNKSTTSTASTPSVIVEPDGEEEVTPLHPALFSNPWFHKILAQEIKSSNESLSDENAVAAVKQLMSSMEKSDEMVTSGVVYDVALKTLGKNTLKSLWSDASHKSIKEKGRNITTASGQFHIQPISSRPKKKEVVPVGLIRNNIPSGSKVCEESILPDDEVSFLDVPMPSDSPTPTSGLIKTRQKKNETIPKVKINLNMKKVEQIPQSTPKPLAINLDSDDDDFIISDLRPTKSQTTNQIEIPAKKPQSAINTSAQKQNIIQNDSCNPLDILKDVVYINADDSSNSEGEIVPTVNKNNSAPKVYPAKPVPVKLTPATSRGTNKTTPTVHSLSRISENAKALLAGKSNDVKVVKTKLPSIINHSSKPKSIKSTTVESSAIKRKANNQPVSSSSSVTIRKIVSIDLEGEEATRPSKVPKKTLAAPVQSKPKSVSKTKKVASLVDFSLDEIVELD